MWAPWKGPGLEHLRLSADEQTIRADGVILGLTMDRPFRIRYRIRCDTSWRVRKVDVRTTGSDKNEIHLRADGEGRWTTTDGRSLPALDGCVDVDLSVTPFTNTLPIQRLRLRAGEAADLSVVYIDAPALDVSSVRQRYACLSFTSESALYRYESLPYDALPDGFTADLLVDHDGLVSDYPGLYRRVWGT